MQTSSALTCLNQHLSKSCAAGRTEADLGLGTGKGFRTLARALSALALAAEGERQHSHPRRHENEGHAAHVAGAADRIKCLACRKQSH